MDILATLKQQFLQEVAPSKPNDWEVEDALEPLLELDPEERAALMSHVHVVWPVSHSLCFSYLENGIRHIARLGKHHLPEWVRQLLFYYETQGLVGARSYMAEVEENFFGRLSGTAGVSLESVRSGLLPFIRGVSARQLEIGSDVVAWTDTETIFLPERLDLFTTREDNSRFYSYLACCQWAYLELGTFAPAVADLDDTVPQGEGSGVLQENPEAVLDRFDDPNLAAALFHYFEFCRVVRMLASDLPGLWRNVKPLLDSSLQSLGRVADRQGTGVFYPLLCSVLATGEDGGLEPGEWFTPPDTTRQSLHRVETMYADIAGGVGKNDWHLYQHLTGSLRFDRVRERATRRRAEQRGAFIQQLALVIAAAVDSDVTAVETEPGETGGEREHGQVAVSLTASDRKDHPSHTLRVNNEEMELPAELAELAAAVARDLGRVPDAYVQAAAGVAGRGRHRGGESAAESGASLGGADSQLYDEWDYRRQGYRKNWCRVIEKDMQPVQSRFVAATLSRYRGLITKLRRQFEMLRTQHRYIRRRRHGDDIDFDALIDAIGDRQAGLTPSDRLFVRLLRNERDIAVMFLVDMSNSTEGWVGRAIKEALVILGDVLEVAGDRFAVYGFSGMRRSRCEVYRIKQLDEPYSEAVRQRVCAISPREYTRMAPAVRHLADMLAATDARVRLLICLTDGKPEDYDDYRGEYAVEDTRQSLIEARGKGIVPFCITVDREAQDYLAHMCGRGNYLYVDSVEKLPGRMVEIYRAMTS